MVVHNLVCENVPTSFRKGRQPIGARRIAQTVTMLALALIALRIISVDFEKLANPYLDARNMCNIAAGLFLIANVEKVLGALHKRALLLLGLFFSYSLAEAFVSLIRVDKIPFTWTNIWTPLLLLLLFYAARTPRKLELMFSSCLLIIAFSAAFGLLMTFVGGPFLYFWERAIASPDAHDRMLLEVVMRGRVLGLSSWIFEFSYQVAAMTAGSLAALLGARHRHHRLLWSFVFLLSCTSLVMCGERSALIGAAVGTVFVVRKSGIKMTWMKLLLLVPIAWWVLFGNFADALQAHLGHSEGTYLKQRLGGESSGEYRARLQMQIAGAATVLKNPLGASIETYQTEAWNTSQDVRMFFGTSSAIPSSHNHFIQVGMHSGWIGWLIAALTILMTARCIRSFNLKTSVCDSRYGWVYCGIVGGFLATIVNSLFHNAGLFFGEASAVVFLGLIGAGASIPLRPSFTQGRGHRSNARVNDPNLASMDATGKPNHEDSVCLDYQMANVRRNS